MRGGFGSSKRRHEIATTCYDRPVTGTRMMRVLDAVETGERKANNAVVPMLDAAQAALRYAGKMIRKGRR